MRRVILADKNWSPEGHPEVIIRYGALTPAQFREAEAIKEQHVEDQMAKHGPNATFTGGIYCIQYLDFINRHGIRYIKGLEVEDPDGSVRQLKIEAQDGLYGKAITVEDYDEIRPFFPPEILTMRALDILLLYQTSSSDQAG